MGRVIVVGSLNIDTVLRVAQHPRPGETVHALDALSFPGGKGGNQAVAAADAGAQTLFVGAVGADGARYLRHLDACGVNAAEVVRCADIATGAASVVVDEHGENSIIVVEGSNGRVQATQLEAVELQEGDVVSLQFELPDAVNAEVAACASRSGATVLINPSPWRPASADLLALADVVIVNEIEAAQLGGIVSADALCITAGGDGARWGELSASAPRIEPVDTTGAGDRFAGTLAALLAQGRTRQDALAGAVIAASEACLQHGAQQWRSV